MRHFLAIAAALAASAVAAAASPAWTFSAGKLDISGTPYVFDVAGTTPVRAQLKPDDKFKLLLTVKLDDEPKKPHQCMLLVKDSHAETEANVVIPVKAGGRGSLALSTKDLGHVLTAHGSVELTLVIGGFGEQTPLLKHVATLELVEDEASSAARLKETAATRALRYGALPEITHTFRQPEQMPPAAVSVLFSGVLLVGLAALAAAWLVLGANLDALPAALRAAPLSYGVFLGSLAAMEASLFLYWTSWRIMTALAVLATLAVPAFFSGRSALRETEKRRKAGLR